MNAPPEGPAKPTRADVESAIMDAMGDVHTLTIVLAEANESPRHEKGERPAMMIDHETFDAWKRTCNHVADSMREVERLFYEAGR